MGIVNGRRILSGYQVGRNASVRRMGKTRWTVRSVVWIAASALVAVLVPLIAFGTQVGSCVDYAPGSGSESHCTSGPALGVPGAWLVSAVAWLLAGYGVYRALRAH